MITCKTILVANQIILDEITKNISAISILEDSTIVAEFGTFSLSILTAFDKTKDDKTESPNIWLKIYLDDEELHKLQLNIRFGVNSFKSRNIASLGGLLVVKRAGQLIFKVVLDNNRTLKEVSFEITKAQPNAISATIAEKSRSPEKLKRGKIRR
ncbi:MAG: hypothetical protein Q8M15_07370 [Bacteroidota bacterium]|nr:hypothetical protein [Bacteroidota bacterium]